MSILTKVERAQKRQSHWAKSGIRSCVKYNQQNGTNFVHDVQVMSPYINAVSDELKELLLSPEGISLLKEDVSSIHLKDNGSTTYSPIYTYVLTMTESRFGQGSVRKDIANDPYGFRGFENRPDIIEFVQDLTKITLQRISIRFLTKTGV
jgi:hypothetical protein